MYMCRVEYSCRVVAGLVILQGWTFVGTFPPLNTFPTGPRPVFFRFTAVVALFPVVLSVFCFRSCPFGRLFLPVLARPDFSVISIDVTGVSLSLSLLQLLTKVTHAQYRKRFRASYCV